MRNEAWIIRGGTVIDPELGEVVQDVRLEQGRITHLGNGLPLEGAQVYDARGKAVFPGFIDTHVHLGYMAPVADEISSESRSAAVGGTTTMCHFAKVLKHTRTQGSYHAILDRLYSDINTMSYVDIVPHLHLSTYEQVDEIPSYAARGLTSYKLYMSYKDDRSALARGTVGVGDGVVFAALKKTAATPGTLAMIHCENWDLIEFFERSLPEAEPSFIQFADTHPGIAEADHVRTACSYAEAVGAPVYLVHISSKEGLEAAREFRQRGIIPVHVETCPHYLMLTKHDANDMPGAMAKTTPPVRDRDHIDALWGGIEDGTIDTIGSDHAMCPMKYKERVSDGVAGFAGVETAMPLVITEAIRRGIPQGRIASVTSTNAARIFGLTRKGLLRVGKDADISIVDLTREAVINARDLHSAAGYSPFEGFQTRAYVEATFLRGRPVWSDQRFTEPARGQVVLRDDHVANPNWRGASGPPQSR